jgi:hyperosmotically inducible protein
MRISARQPVISLALIAAVAAAATLSEATLRAQSANAIQAADMVRRALVRLPYYGVFDFLAFRYERGTVTLMGYAYRGSLKADADEALRRTPGVDEIVNHVEILPLSLQDDRIRWATFYGIYTDSFLSRYAPGGPMISRYDLLSFTRFPGMQPFGNYPIHIVVKNQRTMLLGVVDSDADRTVAGFRAREVTGVFVVENELVVDKY